jgi:hypothetical protein
MKRENDALAPSSLSLAWEEMKREDDVGHHQAELFVLHHELFATIPVLSLFDILGASPSPPASLGATSGGVGLLNTEDEDVARCLRGQERWVYCCRLCPPCCPSDGILRALRPHLPTHLAARP